MAKRKILASFLLACNFPITDEFWIHEEVSRAKEKVYCKSIASDKKYYQPFLISSLVPYLLYC